MRRAYNLVPDVVPRRAVRPHGTRTEDGERAETCTDRIHNSFEPTGTTVRKLGRTFHRCSCTSSRTRNPRLCPLVHHDAASQVTVRGEDRRRSERGWGWRVEIQSQAKFETESFVLVTFGFSQFAAEWRDRAADRSRRIYTVGLYKNSLVTPRFFFRLWLCFVGTSWWSRWKKSSGQQ